MKKAFTRELREPRPGEIQAFLARHCSKLEPDASGELRFAPCPVCNNRKSSGGTRAATSATVNPKTGLWRCWDGACRAKGNWLTLTRAFGEELPRTDRYKDQRPEDTWKLRDWYATQKRQPVTAAGASPALLHYCHERGITDETLNRFLVSTAFYPIRDREPPTVHEALRWPIHAWQDKKWVMVNAKLKKCLNHVDGDAKSRFEKSGGPTQLLIGQHLISAAHGERLFIFEGEFDAMTADQLGLKNSVSIPNGASAINVGSILRYIPDDWPIYLGMDMDQAGKEAVEAFFLQCEPKRLIQLVLPEDPAAEPGKDGKRPRHKDLNAWFKATGFKLTADQVMDTAVGLGILKPRTDTPAPVSFGQIQMRVAARQSREDTAPRLVCPFPWPAMTEMFKGGLLSRQTTGLLAPSGIGKTTLVNQIAIYAAASECRTGLLSFEDARDDLYENINQAALGTLDVDAVARTADNLFVSELEGSDLRWEEVLEEMERLARLGCRLIIVDNLDHIVDRANQVRGMDMKIMAYAAMIKLAKRYDLHVLVVWQCGKVDRGVVVNSGSMKGYAQTFLDAANYLNMNRVVIDGVELTQIEIEKARAAGASLNRNKVYLQYVDAKRSFFQVDGNIVTLQSLGGNGVAPF